MTYRRRNGRTARIDLPDDNRADLQMPVFTGLPICSYPAKPSQAGRNLPRLLPGLALAAERRREFALTPYSLFVIVRVVDREPVICGTKPTRTVTELPAVMLPERQPEPPPAHVSGNSVGAPLEIA